MKVKEVLGHLAKLWADHQSAIMLGAAAAVIMLVVTALVASRALRVVRGASGDAKLTVGTAFVQAGVTWAVVTGTYEFCDKVFGLPWWEAATIAAFFEAATWVTVGMIRAHAKSGKEGFGPAGPFFWLFSALGGLLAVIAGRTHGEMVGRAVVVVIGSCLWYLSLLRWIKRSGKPGTLKWTPRRLLVAIGAIEPGDADVRDENREWQIRRLARAMRWANGRWPLSWLGQRSLIRRGESTQEDVITDARRRYAVTHLLTATCDPGSDVMRRVIADIVANLLPAPSESDDDQDDVPPPPPPPSPKRGTDTYRRTRTGTPGKTRTAAKPGTRTDAELIAALADVPREADGTVPVRRAAAVLGTGPDRARKLLAAEGLLRIEHDTRPVNGQPVPDLIDA